MQFPVWSSSISATGTVKETLANVNSPMICAGVQIYPGDFIIADDDGVVVVKRQEAESVLQKSLAREANEEEKRKQFEEGELGLDVYKMRQRLAEKGLKYVKARPED
jgi:4-hydroxy-4-methyl-2-oxoglutarate aldolase